MTIRNAILGLLSWKPLSGYDLKKLIADSGTFYWSGNNNQIYRALLELNDEGLVTSEVQMTEALPVKKVYTLTPVGHAALRRWVQTAPELPETRRNFLIQLAWADVLTAPELDALLAAYESEVAAELVMQEEQARRMVGAPNRTARERFLWQKIDENFSAHWRIELAWVRSTRQGLLGFEQSTPEEQEDERRLS